MKGSSSSCFMWLRKWVFDSIRWSLQTSNWLKTPFIFILCQEAGTYFLKYTLGLTPPPVTLGPNEAFARLHTMASGGLDEWKDGMLAREIWQHGDLDLLQSERKSPCHSLPIWHAWHDNQWNFAQNRIFEHLRYTSTATYFGHAFASSYLDSKKSWKLLMLSVLTDPRRQVHPNCHRFDVFRAFKTHPSFFKMHIPFPLKC